MAEVQDPVAAETTEVVKPTKEAPVEEEAKPETNGHTEANGHTNGDAEEEPAAEEAKAAEVDEPVAKKAKKTVEKKKMREGRRSSSRLVNATTGATLTKEISSDNLPKGS